MRPIASAALLLAACVTLPPLRPADPAQAVANEKSAGTAFANGIRIVVRPGAWKGGDDVEQVVTPVEVAIHNDGGRAVQVRPASFSLLVPGGFRYDALSPEDVRRALGPMRGGYGYAFVPRGPQFFPWAWAGPYGGWWGWNGFGPSPWWSPVVAYGGRGYGRVPSHAFARGTLEPGGDATILLFFPVPAEDLNALELAASLSDELGQKVAELRVPFVREGRHAEPMPLPRTAREPQAPAEPEAAPAQPPVDAPVGPPVPAPETAPPSPPP